MIVTYVRPEILIYKGLENQPKKHTIYSALPAS